MSGGTERIIFNNLIKQVVFVALGISIAAAVIGFPIMYKIQVGKANTIRTEQVQKQNNDFEMLKNRKYITINQFNTIFNKAKKIKNTKLLKQLNDLQIVDNSNGHIFKANVKDNAYQLMPVKVNGKTKVDRNWAKNNG